MATNPISVGKRESFLLELLYFAGWQLQIRCGNPTTIRATRDDTALEVTETSLAQAAGVVFARARLEPSIDPSEGESWTRRRRL